ncbi:MAG: response regulator transcription factor [Myxococcales bacterium]|nr:response regulator transcription factor [Myxococcales bacterium]
MKVLLADDHAILRHGLRAILERAGVEVVGEAANGRDVLAVARRLRPDVVVMDISMPELNGIDATRQLVAEMPHVKVLGLSMHCDRRYVLAMFHAGAAGYLLKDSASDELITAVQALGRDQKYVSPAIADVLVEASAEGKAARAVTHRPLSAREREVLQLLAEGHGSKEIASHLSISVPTVETHRRQIMQKLGLHTIAELTKYAIREGLTSVDR